ncbi:MAG: hypothetical protein KAW12_09280, partial [Candidatus Aminicenantes bacterium]|nr:hypothetical protein [Candidatus Aminicenantes bacterium]
MALIVSMFYIIQINTVRFFFKFSPEKKLYHNGEDQSRKKSFEEKGTLNHDASLTRKRMKL